MSELPLEMPTAPELPLEVPKSRRRAVRKRKVDPASDKVVELTTETAPLSKVNPAVAAGPHPFLKLKDMGPQSLWFLGAALTGTVVHVLSAFPDPLLRSIGWAGPLLASVAYPVYGVVQGWHRTPASREKFADNSYYLGFIFTQVALVIGFVPMTFFNAELGSQDVLRAFSVALGASLIGLVARTLLVQTSHTVTENADIIENEVEALARAVSRQTQVIVAEFEQLGGRLTKTYVELDSELQTCVGHLAATFQRYEAAVAKDAAAVEAATTVVEGATREARTAIDAGAATFAARTADAAKSLEVAKEALKLDLAEAVQALQATTHAMARGADALGQIPAFGEAVDTLSDRVDAVTSAIGRLDTLVLDGERALADTARRTAGALDQTAALVSEDLKHRANAFQSEVDGAVQSLEETLARFKAELERTRE